TGARGEVFSCRGDRRAIGPSRNRSLRRIGRQILYIPARGSSTSRHMQDFRTLPQPIMAITLARAALGRIFYQRCFYLFLVLLALIVVVPFIEPTPAGRFLVNVTGTAVVIAAVATVGRTR